jgi:coenzyme PQQ precursor peptide PqqA
MNELNTQKIGQKNPTMNEWKKPELEEIPLSCEISSYAPCDLPDDTF